MVSLRAHLGRSLTGPHRLLRLAPVLALAAWAFAQPAPAADTNAILTAWFAAQTNLQTWSASFIQTRSLKTLVQPLTSTGRVSVAFPDRFRWELGDPPQTIALRRSEELLVIYPRLKRVERYPLDASQTGPWRDAAAMLEAGFPRSRADLESRFRLLSVTETNAVSQITLQPKSAMARKLMPELRVTLKTQPFSVIATEMQFADGSRMRNDFTNEVFNPKLDPVLFDFKPGADFTVVHPTR
jgi:outer membrane lipoprotein-sorting protein